jgi:hypothetical protein
MEAFSGIFSTMAGVPGLAILVLAALAMFLTSDWRLSITALLVEYVALGLVLTRFVPAEIAIAKILTGVFVVFMLYLTARRVQETRGTQALEGKEVRFLGLPLGWAAGPLGLPLRLLVVLLAGLGLVRLFTGYDLALVSIDIAFVASWLGTMGLLGLVLGGDLLRTALALLTILIGFDLVYSGLEPNLAIAGMFAAFTLIATLALSYLMAVEGLALSDSSRTVSEPSQALSGQSLATAGQGLATAGQGLAPAGQGAQEESKA